MSYLLVDSLIVGAVSLHVRSGGPPILLGNSMKSHRTVGVPFGNQTWLENPLYIENDAISYPILDLSYGYCSIRETVTFSIPCSFGACYPLVN